MFLVNFPVDGLIATQPVDEYQFILLARVVQRMDNAIHQIFHYPANSMVCFVNTYPLNSDLSAG